MAQQQSPLRTQPHRWIADGHYTANDATEWRWYIEQISDLPPPLLLQTIQGGAGADFITVQDEVADACRATACAAIERLIATRAAKDAKKMSRRI